MSSVALFASVSIVHVGVGLLRSSEHTLSAVIPAKAGIQGADTRGGMHFLDSRLRGNDGEGALVDCFAPLAMTDAVLADCFASLAMTGGALAMTDAALADCFASLAMTGATLAMTGTALADCFASLAMTGGALAMTGAALAMTGAALADCFASLAMTGGVLAMTGAARQSLGVGKLPMHPCPGLFAPVFMRPIPTHTLHPELQGTLFIARLCP